jgi:protein MpaA
MSWPDLLSAVARVILPEIVMSSSVLPLNPADFISQFDAAARRADLKVQTYGEITGHPLNAYTKRTPGIRPRVYISTGMHGDEPAPPLALLRLVEEGFFDERCTWFICPLLNPTGFALRTRENFGHVDLNRDYKSLVAAEVLAHVAWLRQQPRFDLAVCGHEDWEAQGFYLYEVNLGGHPTLANAMITAARAHGPIENATVIDGREIAEPGIIRPTADPAVRETWPESLYLAYNHCTLNYTIESASAQPIEQRIATQCAVLKAAIGALMN